MRFVLLLAVATLALLSSSCSKAEASPPGITLVGQLDDLVLAGDPGGAHPPPSGLTQTAADRRYCRLTGCTMTGSMSFTGGADISLAAGSVIGGGTALLEFSGNSVSTDGNDSITAGSGGLDTTGPSLATTYFRSRGAATASLVVCNAATEGGLEYDTSVNRLALCDDRGGAFAWRYLVSSDTGTEITIEEGFQSSLPTVPSTEAANYNGVWLNGANTAATAQRIVCQIGAGGAGVLGAAVTGVVMKVRDLTGSLDVCSCTLSSGTAFCNALAGAFDSCTCSGAMVTGRVYGVQMSATTDCGTNPGNLFCTVAVVRTLTAGQVP